MSHCDCACPPRRMRVQRAAARIRSRPWTSERLGRGDIVAAAGGLLLFLSLFLPWFSVSA